MGCAVVLGSPEKFAATRRCAWSNWRRHGQAIGQRLVEAWMSSMSFRFAAGDFLATGAARWRARRGIQRRRRDVETRAYPLHPMQIRHYIEPTARRADRHHLPLWTCRCCWSSGGSACPCGRQQMDPAIVAQRQLSCSPRAAGFAKASHSARIGSTFARMKSASASLSPGMQCSARRMAASPPTIVPITDPSYEESRRRVGRRVHKQT